MAARVYLVCTLLLVAACSAGSKAVRVSDFAALYESTTFAQGVVGAVPLPRERRGEAPTVVNWFYAGSSGAEGAGVHRVVLRTATWDAAGEPVTGERWYLVPADQLVIVEPMSVTRDVARWVPLHEAAEGIAPPPGLDSWRERIDPQEIDPAEVELDPDQLPPNFPLGE